MKIYVPVKLQDVVSTADVLFNDKMLGWFGKKKKCYFIVFKKNASSSLREPPTGALHGISPGVQSREQATINH